MDNFNIDIQSEGLPNLIKSMELAFRGLKAVGYMIHPSKGLIFFWCESKSDPSVIKFPFEYDPAGAADFTKRWLDATSYPPEPDHDGDNGKGWRLYTESWGQVGDWYESLCAIRPVWAMYGK